MKRFLARPLALAGATQRDLIRRPGAALLAGSVIVLLALLPRFASRALDDHGSLSIELSISTISLTLSVVAGVAGVLVTAADSPLGPAAELSTSPLRWAEYVAGRFGGIVSASGMLLVALLGTAALGSVLAGGTPSPALGGLMLAVTGLLLQAALFAAVGSVLGACLPTPTAVVGLIAFLIASRLVIPGLLDSDAAALGYALPDPARLELAREVGFDRPIAARATLLAWAAAAAQTCGLLTVTTLILERRST